MSSDEGRSPLHPCSNSTARSPLSRISRMMGKTVWTIFLVLTGTTHALGQQLELRPDELTRFDAVRLRAPALSQDVMVGKVIEVDSTGLVLRQRGLAPLVVPLNHLEHVEVMFGKQRLGPAALGFAVGALAAGIGFKHYADAKNINDEWNGFVAVVKAAPIGGLVGAVVGAAKGRAQWAIVQVVPRSEGSGR